MMIRYVITLLIGCSVFTSTISYALTKVDLYTSEIIIDPTQENGENFAIVQGMLDVIIRASGDTFAFTNDVVARELKRSASFVSKVSYGSIRGEKSLKVSFSEPQIRNLLTNANLPYWQNMRTNILVWMIDDTDQNARVLWDNDNSPYLLDFKQMMNLRGLPVTIPTGDLNDRLAHLLDFTQEFLDPIINASLLYAPDAILVIVIENTKARWTLYDQKPQLLSAQSLHRLTGVINFNENNVTQDVANEIADYYAAQNSTIFSKDVLARVTLKVNNLDSVADFFSLENSLLKLNAVHSVQTQRIYFNQQDIITDHKSTNQALLSINLLAPLNIFRQQLKTIANLRLESELPHFVPTQLTSANRRFKTILTATNSDQISKDKANKDSYDLLYFWLTN